MFDSIRPTITPVITLTMAPMSDLEADWQCTSAMFDALPAGVCIAAPTGRIVYANPELHILLGHPQGSLAGGELGALPIEPAGGGEWCVVRPDGGRLWLAVAVSPYAGLDGTPWELRVFTDVTHHRRAEAALRNQLLMKDVLFETLPVPVFIKDQGGRFADCNEAFERYTGLPRGDVIDKTSPAVMDPVIAGPHVEMDRTLHVNWGQRSYEETVPYADGTVRHVRVSKAVYRDAAGGFGGIVGVIHDMDVQPSEARLDVILEQSPIGVSVSRRDTGIIQFANTRFAELVGLSRDQLVGSRARDYYVDNEQRDRVVERLKMSGSVLNMEVQFKRADGSAFWTLFTVNHTIIQGVPVNLAWIYDYTERRNMEEALRDMASKDPLTGIYNRRSFMEVARQQMSRAHRHMEPMSMLVLDVDHFKRVNDSFGHATGDEALRMVASGCQGILRDYDVLGRLGGEEFVVCLPGTTPDEACVVAERLRRSLGRMAIPGPEGNFSLTVSIGLSGVDSAADTLEKAIHRADVALYRAKNSGRNRVVVHEPEM